MYQKKEHFYVIFVVHVVFGITATNAHPSKFHIPQFARYSLKGCESIDGREYRYGILFLGFLVAPIPLPPGAIYVE